MANRYETVFILTPVLSGDQVKEAVAKVRELITTNGGKIMHEENWDLRKLAYPIEKKSTGFYNLFEFEAEGEAIAELELELKRDERIIRFLTVKLEKYAIQYVESRKNRTKTTA